MTKQTVIPFEDRVEKAAKILKITPENLKDILKLSGVDDVSLLDASTTSHNDIHGILCTKEEIAETPLLKLKVAVGILKGENPFSKEETTKKDETTALSELIKSNKPVANWSDREVLEKYIESDQDDLEAELQKRSKNRPFVILKEGTKEEVDVDASLLMLRKARKDEVPDSMTTPEGKYVRIYKVEQYHIENRIRYESPLRPGVILFDGYCSDCKLNFNKVSKDARIMLRLIYEEEGEQSRAGEKILVETAEKGIKELAGVYPDIYDEYKEKELTETLPSLTRVASLENGKSDPFYESEGNHRKY